MIETNIQNAIIANTTISGIVGDNVFCPFAPKETVAPYIAFFPISEANEYYETYNDTLYQFDIYVGQGSYKDAQTIKNELKKLFLTAYIEDCILTYITSTNDFQSDESMYRIIMTYRVNSKI